MEEFVKIWLDTWSKEIEMTDKLKPGSVGSIISYLEKTYKGVKSVAQLTEEDVKSIYYFHIGVTYPISREQDENIAEAKRKLDKLFAKKKESKKPAKKEVSVGVGA